MARKEAVARLLEEWQPLIWTIARDRAHGEHSAEDLAQEISLVVWQKLLVRPDAPREYLSMVAKYAALKARVRGRSVHRQHTQAKKSAVGGWVMVHPDAGEIGWDQLVEPTRRRRGGLLSPVEDLAVAVVLCEELCRALTLEEAAFLDLRLQGYGLKEAGATLGLSSRQAREVADGVRRMACRLLGEEAPNGSNGASENGKGPAGPD